MTFCIQPIELWPIELHHGRATLAVTRRSLIAQEKGKAPIQQVFVPKKKEEVPATHMCTFGNVGHTN